MRTRCVGTDFSVTESGVRDTVRQILLPFWNSWYFLALYSDAENTVGTFRTDSTHVLDRYVLAKTSQLIDRVTDDLDAYDLFSACAEVRDFLDVLTNWYIRRSRDRFWAGDRDAIDTLHTVLVLLSQVSAPLLPLLSEHLYQGLTGSESVHLTAWPERDVVPADDELVEVMDTVREICSVALSVRKAHGRRVRQPLRELRVSFPGAERIRDFADIVADEVNVKTVTLSDEVSSSAAMVLQAVPAALGPRLGGRTQDVIKAIKSGDWSREGDRVVAGGIELLEGEYTLKIATSDGEASATMSDGRGVVTLDTEITPELEAEGTARDLVRLVQQARRESGLAVSDRIALTLGVPESIRRRVQPFVAFIAAETLAESVHWGVGEPTVRLDDDDVYIGVERVH